MGLVGLGSIAAGGCSSSSTDVVSAPTLGSLSSTSSLVGSTVSETLTGTGFVTNATTVSVAGGGITVSSVTVSGTTSLTATFTVDATAAIGPHNVTVTTSGGTSAATPFTVTPPPPTLSGININSAVAGTAVTRILTGTNFVSGGTTITVSGTGVTVSSVAVVNSTSVTALFTLASNATLGDHTVTVITAGGITSGAILTVFPTTPSVTGVSPASASVGTTLTVTLTGTSFVAPSTCTGTVCSGGTTVTVGGTGVTVGPVTVSSSTSLTAVFTIAANATAGARSLAVSTSGGSSSTLFGAFTVNP